MMLSNYSTYWASLVDAYLIITVGKPPKSRKKAKKNEKTPKNGYFIFSESQKTHLSEKSFRVLSSEVKILGLVGVSAKIKKIGPLYCISNFNKWKKVVSCDAPPSVKLCISNINNDEMDKNQNEKIVR